MRRPQPPQPSWRWAETVCRLPGSRTPATTVGRSLEGPWVPGPNVGAASPLPGAAAGMTPPCSPQKAPPDSVAGLAAPGLPSPEAGRGGEWADAASPPAPTPRPASAANCPAQTGHVLVWLTRGDRTREVSLTSPGPAARSPESGPGSEETPPRRRSDLWGAAAPTSRARGSRGGRLVGAPRATRCSGCYLEGTPPTARPASGPSLASVSPPVRSPGIDW